VSLPLGAKTEFERELWVEGLQRGIDFVEPAGGEIELEVLDDSSDEDIDPTIPPPADQLPDDGRPLVTGDEKVALPPAPKEPAHPPPPKGPEDNRLPKLQQISEPKAPAPAKAAAKAAAKNTPPAKATRGGAKETKLEADETGVIGVVCEAVELAIENEAKTEEHAVAVVRQHLGANEDQALDRAVALWCKRFDVDLPEDAGAKTLPIIAKWIFWVIQARTLLRARFEGKGGKSSDPFEDMVLGEWAGELGLTLADVAALHADPGTRDEVTRDLAFWFSSKAQDEAHAAAGGQGKPKRRESVTKRPKAEAAATGGRPGAALNAGAAALATGKTATALRSTARVTKAEAAKEGAGPGGEWQEARAQEAARKAGAAANTATVAAAVGAAAGGGKGGDYSAAAFQAAVAAAGHLVALEELNPVARATAFRTLSPDEKAEVLIDLTPVERAPLLALLDGVDTAEMLAMDDVVMALSGDELVKAGAASTSLAQRALALTRLGRDAKFKLFCLEGRTEAVEVQQAKAATLGHRDGAAALPVSEQAIKVVVSARVGLYHLLDHRSRIECISSFSDRRERTDLLQALTSDSRQELIDACVAAEMAGNRDWFHGWDWFDWFDFNPNSDYDDDDSDAAREAREALKAYADLVADDPFRKAAAAEQALEEDEDGSLHPAAAAARAAAHHAARADGAAASPDAPSKARAEKKKSKSVVEEYIVDPVRFALLGAEALATGDTFGGSDSERSGDEEEEVKAGDRASAAAARSLGGGFGVLGKDGLPLPMAVAEAERLARRDMQMRDLEDGLRKIQRGDGDLAQLLDSWRAFKETERNATASLAAIARSQDQARKERAAIDRATSGRQPTAAEKLQQRDLNTREEEAVRSQEALKMAAMDAASSARGVEEAMAQARKLLLPSAHDRSDLAVLAQRVSVSYFSEVEFVKTQLQLDAGARALALAKDAAAEGIKSGRGAKGAGAADPRISAGDAALLDSSELAEDLKLRIFTLELENARAVGEAADLRRALSEAHRVHGPGAGAGAAVLGNTSAPRDRSPRPGGGADRGPGAQPGAQHGGEGAASETDVSRLRGELVATRLQVAVLSESIAKSQGASREAEQRARAMEDEAARRLGEFEASGTDLGTLLEKNNALTKELAWVRATLEGCIAAKDRADAKLAAQASQLSTIGQLDPHRWHAGRQNVRLETELRAAREDRDRSVARANKDVAHFKAEIALASDRLERAETQLAAAVTAARTASEGHEGEVADLEQRLLAMQALLDTANAQVDSQGSALDGLRTSHKRLEAEARAAAEKVALYERRALLADESMGDARAQLVALTKTHELMKAAEARRVAAFTKEKAALDRVVAEGEAQAKSLAKQLGEARDAGEAMAKGLAESQDRVALLESDMAGLLEQEADMRGALTETKAVLLKVTADYKQRMGEAALVAKELKAAEASGDRKASELKAAAAQIASLKAHALEAGERADRGATALVGLQQRLAAREAEVAGASERLLALCAALEAPLAAAVAEGGDGGGDGEGAAAQLDRVVDITRLAATLAASAATDGAAAPSGEGIGGSGGGGTVGADAVRAALAKAKAEEEALEELSSKMVANVDAATGQADDDETGTVFSDSVLMSETERILSMIDGVETRGMSQSVSRPRPGSVDE